MTNPVSNLPSSISPSESDGVAPFASWEEEILDLFVGIFESFGLPTNASTLSSIGKKKQTKLCP